MSRTHRNAYGNDAYDKAEKHHEKCSQRMRERDFCIRAKNDTEIAFEETIEEPRPTGCKQNGYAWWRPLSRWLGAHIGQPWNTVYSELIKKLKEIMPGNEELLKKSIAHTVDITPDVRDYGYSYHRGYYVDEEGILQRYKKRTFDKSVYRTVDTNAIAKWLDGRAVGYQGATLFWFSLATKNKKQRAKHGEEWKCEGTNYSWMYNYGLTYLYKVMDPIYDINHEVIGHKEVWLRVPSYLELYFRQTKRLTDKEIAFWNKIPKYFQDEILQFSPTK